MTLLIALLQAAAGAAGLAKLGAGIECRSRCYWCWSWYRSHW